MSKDKELNMHGFKNNKMSKRKRHISPKSEDELFFKELTDYFQKSTYGMVSSIKQLANMQRKFPRHYTTFKNLSREPNLILKLSEKLSSDEKAKLFELFLKSSSLNDRIKILHELTYREKIILANDLEEFAKKLLSIEHEK